MSRMTGALTLVIKPSLVCHYSVFPIPLHLVPWSNPWNWQINFCQCRRTWRRLLIWSFLGMGRLEQFDHDSLINGPKHCRFLILCEYFITRFNPFALNHENIKSQKRRPSKSFSLNESPWDNTPLGEHLTRDSGGLGLVCHYHIVLLTSFVFQYHCS